jgi:hypothetical protein
MRRLLALGLVVFALLMLPTAAWGIGTGKIEGTVNAPGQVDEVEVCIVEQKPSETCTYPAPDGSYILSNVDLGPQRVEFLPSYQSHYLPQYYDHKNTLAEAATISLTQSKPTVEKIDADLLLGGLIQGQVTATVGGAPLAGVEVCALGAGSHKVAGCVDSNMNGEYTLPGLPPGSYKVGFWGKGPSGTYVSEFYADKASFAEASSILVFGEGTKADVDAQLDKGAQVGGTVTEAVSSRRLAGIPVCLFAATGPRPQRCVFTDEAGGYMFSGLASGSYQLGFSLEFTEFYGEGLGMPEDDGYRTQYYGGVPNRAEAVELLLVVPTVRTGIDAKLVSSRESPPPVIPPALPAAPVIIPQMEAAPLPVKKKPIRCRGTLKKVKHGKVRCVKVKKHHRRKHAH